MYTLSYLYPALVGVRAGMHGLVVITSPSYETIERLAGALNRRTVRNVRVWWNGKLVPDIIV